VLQRTLVLVCKNSRSLVNNNTIVLHSNHYSLTLVGGVDDASTNSIAPHAHRLKMLIALLSRNTFDTHSLKAETHPVLSDH